MIIFKKNSSVVQCRHQRCNGVNAGVVSNGVDTSDDTRYSTYKLLILVIQLLVFTQSLHRSHLIKGCHTYPFEMQTCKF